MTVILGTAALATARTILAPSLAMPPDSYLRPTMKPGGLVGMGGEVGWGRLGAAGWNFVGVELATPRRGDPIKPHP
jgi:hypothetical protein